LVGQGRHCNLFVVIETTRKSQRLLDIMEHVLASLQNNEKFSTEGWLNQQQITLC
jgi:hypothetical protein